MPSCGSIYDGVKAGGLDAYRADLLTVVEQMMTAGPVRSAGLHGTALGCEAVGLDGSVVDPTAELAKPPSVSAASVYGQNKQKTPIESLF